MSTSGKVHICRSTIHAGNAYYKKKRKIATILKETSHIDLLFHVNLLGAYNVQDMKFL